VTKNGGLRVGNLLLRGQRPLVNAIYQNQPLSHYLPPSMQLLQGPKRAGKAKGKQFVAQPKGIAKKTARFR
jgi:hypothetical protein